MSKSGSESDNLEFESADEGHNDGDLSDLDLDEILNEDDDAAADESSKKKAQTKTPDDSKKATAPTAQLKNDSKSSDLEQTMTTPNELSKEEDTVEQPQQAQAQEIIKTSNATDTKTTRNDKSADPKPDMDQVDKPKKEHGSTETKEAADIKQESADMKQESAGWAAQDDDVDELINELNLEESHKEQPPKKVEQKAEPSGGWDDSRFSDIDDADNDDKDHDKQEVTTKPVEKEKEIIENKQQALSSTTPSPPPPPSEPKKEQSQATGWSWSKFGTNILSSAATLLETVESHLGAPDPAELANRIAKSKSEYKIEEEAVAASESDKSKDDSAATAVASGNENWNFEDQNDWFKFNKITSTGSNLVAGSLDMLETVGKKTFEMINDKDPNFKQTKELLKKVPVQIAAKPNLSQLLREAQSENTKKAETDTKAIAVETSKPKKKPIEKITFSLYFEEYKGTAHLEALEMLSSQANVKLEMCLLTKPYSKLDQRVKSELDVLDSYFDADKLNDDEDNESDDDDTEEEDFRLLINQKDKMFDVEHFEFLINEYVRKSSLNKIAIDKVMGAYRTTSYASKEILSPTELFNESIKCFALIASNLIELFHKTAEILFLEFEKHNSSSQLVLGNVETLYKITKLSIRGVTILSDDYCKKCKANYKQLNEGNPNQIITDIYLEASNSNTYIGDAFLLFAPIFKSQLLKINES